MSGKDKINCAGEALKSIYPRLISSYLSKIGIQNDYRSKVVSDTIHLIPLWKGLEASEKKNISKTMVSETNLDNFFALMEEISEDLEEEGESEEC